MGVPVIFLQTGLDDMRGLVSRNDGQKDERNQAELPEAPRDEEAKGKPQG